MSDNGVLDVRFSVTIVPNYDSGADAHTIVHTIEGDIGLDGGERKTIGSISAYLFNLTAASGQLADVYDCIDGEIAKSLNSFFDFDEEDVLPNVYQSIGMEVLADFHVHVHTLEIDPIYRGKGYGLVALRALRLFVRRPFLIATAHAAPLGNPHAPSAEIIKLAAYYASDTALGFQFIGLPEKGCLAAKWE